MATQVQTKELIRCSKLQPNKMGCQRVMEYLKPTEQDPSGKKEGLCRVCWLLSFSPAGYVNEEGKEVR